MIVDELKELLRQTKPTLAVIKQFFEAHQIDEQLATLESELQKSDSWSAETQIIRNKERARLRELSQQYHQLITQDEQFSELVDLCANDEQELSRLTIEIKQYTKNVTFFKTALLLNKPEDSSNCFLSINAGAGGTESQDWASMLLRMYVRFCEERKFSVDILDYQEGEGAGIKSATIFIRGKNACGLLKGEHGVHRLVRISPFDANKRRHTSFASVTVIPEVAEVEVKINPQDIRVDTFRSGGAGGQHVNKTESAIRITHIPTGTVVQCQIERSQAQNKATALKMLAAKLAQRAREEQEAREAKIEKKKIEWGSQIRSYVLHPYKMVKDHRTDIESGRPELVLDGDLLLFIESYLLWDAMQHRNQ